MDRRGSGLNRDVKKEPLRYTQWISDVEAVIDAAAKRGPALPVHLMGISWGGRLAVAVGAAKRVRIKTIILSSPGLASRRDYSIWKKAMVLAALARKSKRLFTLPLEDAALFTDDPDEQSYIEGDAYGLREVDASFLLESRRLERHVRAVCRTLGIPVLMFLAGRDEIVDNGKVKNLFAQFRSTDKIMKIFPQARHTLEFDACREEYLDSIVQWLNQKSPLPRKKGSTR
jgi:alpha-beta hydrolase superfamily lysophospholipase